MGFLDFKKNELVNLSYSLTKEIIRSNRARTYASTTIIGCNTRKYHGLLVVPQPQIDDNNHVLLSSIDETVIQNDAKFNLGIHKYPGGIFEPKGHKYVRDFNTEPNYHIIFRVGGVLLKKEYLLVENEARLLIKYTLLEAKSKTKIQIKPYLAFRNYHSLSKSNFYADTSFKSIENGSSFRLYENYDKLNIQFSKKVEYTHFPHWNYNIEYQEEQKRGYDYQEDLLVPGMFEFEIKKGETVIVSAGINLANINRLKYKYTQEVKKRLPRNNMDNCLIHSAKQFFIHQNDKTEIIAGFPWFGVWGRDTFISLPGLTCAVDNSGVTCQKVLNTMVKQNSNGLFPNIGTDKNASFNSIDAPLWFFWAVQNFYSNTNDAKKIWKLYAPTMQSVIEAYINGTNYNIEMHENCLIYGGNENVALTWMDAIVDGKPVTPRTGYNVEINALWYNALMFTSEIAKLNNKNKLSSKYSEIANNTKENFNKIFWDDKNEILADTINGDFKDFSTRPNQIFAVSLPYEILNSTKFKLVVDKVKSELLTPKGLRTLSPKNKNYKGIYCGNQKERDLAYHQGTVWPWLLGAFVDAYTKVYSGKSALKFIEKIYKNFNEDMMNHGIGTISEVYDGDPPHNSGGTISQAWSVSELLRIKKTIEKLKNNNI